jgi:hypothetical protein
MDGWLESERLTEAVRRGVRNPFKKNLAQEMPKLRIAWAQPYNDTIIELHIEYDKHTYKKSLKASKLAFEVEEKTGVTMIFR